MALSGRTAVIGVAALALAGGAALVVLRPRNPAPVKAVASTSGADAKAGCGSLPMRCLDAVDRYLGDPSQAGRVAQELERVCQSGQADGCDALVPFLAAGAGVERDAARAFKLSDEGCTSGDPAACNNLGILYLGGIGVEKDEIHALHLFDDLCRKQNQPRACFNAAALYDAGPLAIRDPAKAADYYTRLCNYGDANSCLSLGNLFLDGRGVEKDAHKAKELFTLACRSGLKPACHNAQLMQ